MCRHILSHRLKQQQSAETNFQPETTTENDQTIYPNVIYMYKYNAIFNLYSNIWWSKGFKFLRTTLTAVAFLLLYCTEISLLSDESENPIQKK